MKNSRILSRFISSLVANLLRALLSFATGILLARGLGPEEYGVFAFLLASFTALTQLLDMGTSNAFFTFSSKRFRARSHILYYTGWLLVQFLLSVLFIGVIAPDSWIDQIWQGESRVRVLIAFVAVFLQYKVWQTIVHIGESQRLTHRVQALSVMVGVTHILLVIFLYWSDNLSIEIIYYILIGEFLLAALVAYMLFPLQYSDNTDSLSQTFKEYRTYCLPLIAYVWITMLAELANSWFLQKYAGPVQQAYYAVAVQFAAVSLIATRSVLNILWKEVAEAYAQNNIERVRKLFDLVTRALFHIGAAISGFLIPWATNIINVTLGEAYLGGVIAMSLMFIYPVDQARGQVSGSMYLAMGKTRPYVVIGVMVNIIGLLATYFILAPTDAKIPGLGLGATGLAIKMLAVQSLSVNVYLWWLSRYLNMSFAWAYQITGLGTFLLLGYLAYWMANAVMGPESPEILRGVVGAMAYAVAAGAVFYIRPSMLGMSRNQMNEWVVKIKQKLTGPKE